MSDIQSQTGLVTRTVNPSSQSLYDEDNLSEPGRLLHSV